MMKSRILRTDNKVVDMSTKFSLICKECYDYAIDIDVNCIYTLSNVKELYLKYGSTISGHIIPAAPSFDSMRITCKCKCRDFMTVPRDMKDTVMTLGKKGYRVYNATVMTPVGTDWTSMFVEVDRFGQFSTSRMHGSKIVKIEPTKNNTNYIMLNYDYISSLYPDLISLSRNASSKSYTNYDIFPLDDDSYHIYNDILEEYLDELNAVVKSLPELHKH